MALRLHTPAAELPVSLIEAKGHLRVEVEEDNALITSLIWAATGSAEHVMGRAIMLQKWQLSLDVFDGLIELQRPTVIAVDSVKYINVAGVLATLTPSLYQLVNASDYTASIVPAYGQVWPSSRLQPESVQVIFSSGYLDATSVPESIKAWIKLCVGAMYANREAVTDRQMHSLGMMDSLLDRYRVWRL